MNLTEEEIAQKLIDKSMGDVPTAQKVLFSHIREIQPTQAKKRNEDRWLEWTCIGIMLVLLALIVGSHVQNVEDAKREYEFSAGKVVRDLKGAERRVYDESGVMP